ncbi:BppU family phage baseplate upper protein [Bacillus mycoides]|uniref:BppU family phage baseplate upper protein n=1 Tax=Bacillus mycoides TaxID=1405 RepID=UPI003D1AB36A
MRDSSVSQVMRYSQNDLKSAKILITVNHNGNEEDFSEATAVRVSFEKGDKKIVYQDCQPINALKGKYQVLLTTQTLTSVGIVTANVHIYFPNDKKIETGSFTFEVVESKMSDEVIKSTDAFPAIHKAIEAGEQLKDINIQALIASKETAEAALQEVNKNKERLGSLQQSLSKQDVKTQTLQHGANLINATVASPLNVEVQGRTLVNLLGQTTLDPTKYYLFMPNKGTTKITAGGSSYDGVAKFTGQSAISYTIKQDFRGKVAGSTIENGNAFKARTGATIGLPINPGDFSERNQNDIDKIKPLDNVLATVSTSGSTNIAQTLFSFDIIRTLQDKYGSQIWQGKTALADKITIAKQLVVDYAAVLYANGSGPQGNKLYVKRWIPSTSTWFGSTTTTESNLTKVQTGSTNVQEIDSNGFIHVIAYADASDGTRPSVVNIDYAMLELKTKMDTDTPLLEDALYEVDQATYNKINVHSDFTGQKLIDKYPYVEGVQHLNPVVVADYGNLIPPFTEWNLHAETTITSPYTMELNATGTQRNSTVSFLINPDTTYTFSYENFNNIRYDLQFRSVDGRVVLSTASIYGGGPVTFKTPSGATLLIVNAYNYPVTSIGELTFKQPMLTVGDKLKPFTPRNPSYLYTNTVLAGYNGVNDVLFKEDGQWKVLRKWERDVVLDGNTSWNSVSLNQNKTGFKEMGAQSLNLSPPATKGVAGGIGNIGFLVEPSGRMSTNSNSSMVAGGVGSYYFSPQTNIYIRVSNTDSGFSEAYFPASDEVKAYFNGWKVKTSDVSGKPIAWKSVVDDEDAPTQTLAYVRASRAAGYTPYKLTYQLAKSRVENVQVEGDLVVDGLTPVTVNSGVVAREKITPNNDSLGKYRINNLFKGGASFKFSPSKIIGIYKNGIDDTRNWHMMYSNDFGHAVGNVWAQISANNFDPTAEYTVTYVVLDKHQFTTNATDVKVSYTQSIRSTTDALTIGQSDHTTSISVLQNLMTDVLARLKANSL